MLPIGRANLRLLFRTDALGGAVTRLCLRVRAVQVDQHCVIDLIRQRRFNGGQVGPTAVAG